MAHYTQMPVSVMRTSRVAVVGSFSAATAIAFAEVGSSVVTHGLFAILSKRRDSLLILTPHSQRGQDFGLLRQTRYRTG